ncbi:INDETERMINATE(ID)-DOMAIN 15, SHOOT GRAVITROPISM 5, ARABIDOPSIS THALIANA INDETERMINATE(ID)-DOMAIN 15 [Hibiscus trionum]|uniref:INDETERMINATE(ID)-DOMAIN 15, SHOOT GRAVITROPISM 5, ARABIDOPSIS THALIANA INDETERMINATE(ID)-DOMAIN 15 n=1 Tax=Hibiscus trionum TaxID=183268 RepID=A0A9W7I7D9_HIBTR|nr:INDETERMINATE(ID)-DOMAIN 15, SHOOT GRAVITROPISM 5, ARABIDOPSIS THALIANA INDETERMINATE(ID)-DOMAIN 15 [Hibiscus trionum]
MLDYATSAFPQPCSSSDPPVPAKNGVTEKRKRKPAGTPDPDAEVVSLSPKTLLESDRYVCEICNQGFQRDQNLQMHRRKHKVAWKLLKKESSGQEAKKRVFVCPEPSCLHHDPCHALGDLVGIKKHFRRKHSNQKQWVCDKCGKGYAVQSDFKAHRKTCGTRGHSCDCGRVFSRVESFIEHQDACSDRRVRLEAQAAAYSSRALSSTSPSSDINFSIYPTTATPLLGLPIPISTQPVFLYSHASMANSDHLHHHGGLQHDLELRLLPPASTHSKLSIGSSDGFERSGENKLSNATGAASEALKELAMAERFRQQARVLKNEATKKMNGIIMEISCEACKHQVQTSTAAVPADETSLAMSYISSATTEGEGE